MCYVRRILILSFFVSSSYPLEKQSVNLNLETVLEFNKHSVERDVKIIDNVQEFLSKVKGVLDETRLGKGADYARRSFSPTQITFTNFIRRALQVLAKFDDSYLRHLAATFDNEARKYHYKGCKFYELVLHPTLRRQISYCLSQMKTNHPKYLKETIRRWQRKFENNEFTEKEREIYDFLDTLYDRNSSLEMFNVLNSLEDYRRQGAKIQPREKITKIIRSALRNIIFDHYSNLNTNVRKDIKLKMASYFILHDSNGTIIRLGQITKVTKVQKKPIGKIDTDKVSFKNTIERIDTDKKSFKTPVEKIETDNDSFKTVETVDTEKRKHKDDGTKDFLKQNKSFNNDDTMMISASSSAPSHKSLKDNVMRFISLYPENYKSKATKPMKGGKKVLLDVKFEEDHTNKTEATDLSKTSKITELTESTAKSKKRKHRKKTTTLITVKPEKSHRHHKESQPNRSQKTHRHHHKSDKHGGRHGDRKTSKHALKKNHTKTSPWSPSVKKQHISRLPKSTVIAGSDNNEVYARAQKEIDNRLKPAKKSRSTKKVKSRVDERLKSAVKTRSTKKVKSRGRTKNPLHKIFMQYNAVVKVNRSPPRSRHPAVMRDGRPPIKVQPTTKKLRIIQKPAYVSDPDEDISTFVETIELDATDQHEAVGQRPVFRANEFENNEAHDVQVSRPSHRPIKKVTIKRPNTGTSDVSSRGMSIESFEREKRLANYHRKTLFPSSGIILNGPGRQKQVDEVSKTILAKRRETNPSNPENEQPPITDENIEDLENLPTESEDEQMIYERLNQFDRKHEELDKNKGKIISTDFKPNFARDEETQFIDKKVNEKRNNNKKSKALKINKSFNENTKPKSQNGEFEEYKFGELSFKNVSDLTDFVQYDVNAANQEFMIKRIWNLEQELAEVKHKIANDEAINSGNDRNKQHLLRNITEALNTDGNVTDFTPKVTQPDKDVLVSLTTSNRISTVKQYTATLQTSATADGSTTLKSSNRTTNPHTSLKTNDNKLHSLLESTDTTVSSTSTSSALASTAPNLETTNIDSSKLAKTLGIQTISSKVLEPSSDLSAKVTQQLSSSVTQKEQTLSLSSPAASGLQRDVGESQRLKINKSTENDTDTTEGLSKKTNEPPGFRSHIDDSSQETYNRTAAGNVRKQDKVEEIVASEAINKPSDQIESDSDEYFRQANNASGLNVDYQHRRNSV